MIDTDMVEPAKRQLHRPIFGAEHEATRRGAMVRRWLLCLPSSLGYAATGRAVWRRNGFRCQALDEWFRRKHQRVQQKHAAQTPRANASVPLAAPLREVVSPDAA